MANRRVSKYESAIELRRTRAKRSGECYSCGSTIDPRDYYYRQSLGLIRKPPRVQFNAFCLDCRYSSLAERLDIGRSNKSHINTTSAVSSDNLSMTSSVCHDEGSQTQLLLFSRQELADE